MLERFELFFLDPADHTLTPFSLKGDLMSKRINTRNQPKPRPVHELRLGRVRAAIWENSTDGGVLHNVTISRLYKNADDQWQDSTSFGRDDLPLVAKVLDRAHSWIFAHTGGTSNGNGADQESGDVPF
jgi:hypothetical protein